MAMVLHHWKIKASIQGSGGFCLELWSPDNLGGFIGENQKTLEALF